MSDIVSKPGTAVRMSDLKAGELALLPKSMFRGKALVLGVEYDPKEHAFPFAVVFGGHPDNGNKAPFIVNVSPDAWGRQVVLRLVSPKIICLAESLSINIHGGRSSEAPGALCVAQERDFIFAHDANSFYDSWPISISGHRIKKDFDYFAEYKSWKVVRAVGEGNQFETLFSWST